MDATPCKRWRDAMTYYHARTRPFGSSEIPAGVCLTTKRDAALSYLYGQPGYLYTVEVEVSHADIHDDEGDLMERGEAAGVPIMSRPYEAADDEDVRAGLIADGFGAVAYEDEAPNTQRAHDCLLILVEGGATVEGVEEVRLVTPDEDEDDFDHDDYIDHADLNPLS
jgi:hypothetical protein